MKSARFHEIHPISLWNPPNFIDEICQISWNSPDFMMKSTGFHEIRLISSWNLPDFMKSAKWAKDPWSYFFICWITLHLLKFQSAAIRKKTKTHWCTHQLQHSSLLHLTGWVYFVYFSISPVHSLMLVMSTYCYFFIL